MIPLWSPTRPENEVPTGMDDIEVKRMYSADDRRKLAKAGDAMPDGSFPIKDEEDLKNAIQAFGRAKDPEAAKTHIIRRATELNMEEMIPESWGSEMTDKKGTGMYDEMEDATDEKAVVRVNMDGEAIKCAKGLNTGCGYKAGAKVCGKCGAMAVETKGDEEDYEEMGEKSYSDGEIFRLNIEDPEERSALRRLHLEDMGTKSAEIDGGAFTCMQEQRVMPGDAAPCADCTGGCISAKGLPDLAEIEAIASTLFGDIVDSGYSDTADRFLVAVERKDGLFEAHFDGKGAFQALVRLPDDWIADEPLVSADEAVVNALDTVEGKALAIDAAVLDGYEVYSVEIEGVDGKSYDVFVDPMDGEVLAYDAYEMSAEEVEAAGDNGSLSVKTVEDPEFAASLMEFALLEAETDTPPADAS